jgi:hypothetical protein
MEPCVWFAAFGGFCINVLGLLELAKIPRAQWPNFREPLYWLPFVFWPVAASVLASAYNTAPTPLTPIVAVNVGASAPLILKTLAATVPFGHRTIDLPVGA